MLGFPKLVGRYLLQDCRMATRLSILCEDRKDRLRSGLVACSELSFTIDHVEVERAGNRSTGEEVQDLESTEVETRPESVVALAMQIKGKQSIPELIARLTEIDGVLRVATVDEEGLD